MTTIPTRDDTFREYAWDYFQLHAEQRLKAFQFFITLATAIVGGFLLLFRYGQAHKWAAVLGVLLIFLSFVFWKLDLRTRGLVKNAEAALKYLDSAHDLPDIDGDPNPLRLFTRDDHETSKVSKLSLLSGHFSYSRCFEWVFAMFALLGALGVFACLAFLPT